MRSPSARSICHLKAEAWQHIMFARCQQPAVAHDEEVAATPFGDVAVLIQQDRPGFGRAAFTGISATIMFR